MPISSLVSFQRGFLPASDPAANFFHYPELNALNSLGIELPNLLLEIDFREYLSHLVIPAWPESKLTQQTLAELQLYYVRLGFLASGYINQIGQPTASILPRNLAIPLVKACQLLRCPPILSYDAYALYNWKRFDTSKSISLDNIDTLQNFVKLYDEHWFILIHVEIEFLARTISQGINECLTSDKMTSERLNQIVIDISNSIKQQTQVLKRTPEKMSPELYFKDFRPYIRFFENVTYEGVPQQKKINFRGETGAQSSILPALVTFFNIPHQESELTRHLSDMRQYMPDTHRQWLQRLDSFELNKDALEKAVFNDALEAIACFREVHYGWAEEYINKHVTDPRGTGGTPYMLWLKQLVNETRAYKIP